MLSYPAGFPEMTIPEDNQLTQSRVELGKKLFFDPRLSRDESVSCASCHHGNKAFTDGQIISPGIEGRLGFRNTTTLANVGYKDAFFADGGVPTLELQVMAPIHEVNEMDFLITEAAQRLNSDEELVELSNKAYGQDFNPFVITRSIAAYERTLISGNSKYDQHLLNPEAEILSAQEMEGMDIFFGERGKCVECHSGFLFSDGDYYNIGLYEQYEDPGRERITLNPEDEGKFMVPTLRNIEMTGPYMHDGSIQTLEEVIDFISSGGFDHINKSPKFEELSLSEEEKQALLAFLKTLTDHEFIERYSE